jgi:hypothetical protein
MPERSDGDRLRRRRFLLLPLVVVEAAGTGYLIVDAAGAFTLPAGHSPREIWLFVAGFLGLFLTVIVCCALAAVPALGRPTLGWLLAPLCAAFLAAFFYSYDHGADGYVPRYADEHSGLGTWVVLVGLGGLLAGGLTYLYPRVGLVCTSALALASFLPIVAIGLAGH